MSEQFYRTLEGALQYDEAPDVLSYSSDKVEVAPGPLTLFINTEQGKERFIITDGDLKIGLATFAHLSREHLFRYRIPWVNSKIIHNEASEYVSYARLKVDLLIPLTKLGLIEANDHQSRGRLLQCDPRGLLSALAGERSYEVTPLPFGQWYEQGRQEGVYPPVVLTHHLIPVIKGLSRMMNDADPQKKLDIRALAEFADIGEKQVQELLSYLVGAEIVSRPHPSLGYLNKHVHQIVHAIASVQDKPIATEIHAPGIFVRPKRERTGGRQPTIPLYESIGIKNDYLWEDAGAEVAQLEESTIAENTRAVFETPLLWTPISRDDYSVIYRGDFPDNKNVEKSWTLAVLDRVGIGPVLLRRLKEMNGIGSSLIDRLERLEQEGDIYDIDVAITVRAHLLTLADTSITLEQALRDARGYSLAECLDLVDLRKEEKIPDPEGIRAENGEVVVFSDSSTIVKRKELPKDKIGELRAVIGAQFDHEIGSINANTVMPAAEMMPVQAYQFHDALRRVQQTRNIPWEELASLGLARLNVDRNSGHPVFSRAGALITSLFMNRGIQQELLKSTRKKPDAIALLAQQVSHMIANRVVDPASSDRVNRYATACLEEFINNDNELACTCSFCQAVHESIQ